MSEFSDHPGDLWGSRVLGSERQLFRVNEEDGDTSDVELRPHATRSFADLSHSLSLMNFPQLCANTIKTIDHIEEKSMTKREFKLKYEKDPSRPAVITGCTANAIWPAGSEHWSPEALKSTLGAETRLEVAQQDCTVSLGEYSEYLTSDSALEDDNPVYIFETLVDGDHEQIIRNFEVPKFFTGLSNTARGCHVPGDTGDLLSEAGDDGLGFGLHRWFLMGGKNSGSNIHTDPLGTSAWNTLLLGQKLWVLFPPDTNEAGLKTAATLDLKLGSKKGCNKSSSLCNQQQPVDFCAAGWFANMLPNLPADIDEQKILFIQEVGETVFVPAGWFHAVLNLSTTVCVTQNFASPYDYSKVSRALYSGGHEENEVADEWRVKVAENQMWSDVLTNSTHQHSAIDFCVHCSKSSSGNICQLLENRPVCVKCENSALHNDEYALISTSDVKKEFGLDLVHGDFEDDEIPPSLEKREGGVFFLRSHIKQMTDCDEQDCD